MDVLNDYVHIILALAVSATLAFFFLLPKRAPKDAPPIVKSTSSIPILGTALEFGASPMNMVRRCYEEYGPVYTVNILNNRMTFLIGPEAQEPFFKLNDDVLSPQECYSFMKPVFGPGVVYDASKKNRQVQFQSMANGLRSSRLRCYVEKIEKETEDFLKDWGEEGLVDIFEVLSELTILTASRCLHGDDVRETLFREVSQLYADLDHGVTPLSVFFPNAPTQAHFKRNRARKEMVKLFSKIIADRRANKGKSDGTDILSIFLDIRYKDGTLISDEEVTGLLIALLFAGQHTSCITSTWTSLFIMSNPHALQKVMDEQKSIDKLDYDSVNQMKYLHDCMREALRLCPPLCLLMRRVKKDIKLTANHTTYVIPQGDTVLVSPTVSMRLHSTFPQADTFCPERYAPGREEHKQPYAYMAFGGGVHSCMGQAFGYLQVKTILSIMFRKYEFKMVAQNMPICDFEAMVVGPKGDCRVTYKKRTVC